MFSDVASRQGWIRVGRAFALWWGGLTAGEQVAGETAKRRLEVCRQCPIFYSPLGTCGTPMKSELRDQGCWCHMETKSKLLGAHCFLDETLGPDAPYGWHRYDL